MTDEDRDHARRDDDDRDSGAAADGPAGAGPVIDDANVPLPWESDDEEVTPAADDNPATSPLPTDAIDLSDAQANADHADTDELVELTRDQTDDTPAPVADESVSLAAAADAVPGPPTAAELPDAPLGVALASDDLSPPAASVLAAEAAAPTRDADDTAYSPVVDTLTCHVVQQHLPTEAAIPAPIDAEPDPADPGVAAPFLEVVDEDPSLPSATGLATPESDEPAGAAAASAGGLIFEPPVPAALVIPALAEPEAEVTSVESADVASPTVEQSELAFLPAAELTDALSEAVASDVSSASVDHLEGDVSSLTPEPPVVASAAVSDYFDINVDAVNDEVPPSEPIPVGAEPVQVDDFDEDEPDLAAASAPIMTYADATTPAEEELVDAEADDIDPKPEAIDAAPVAGGMWTIPMLCLGIAVIACCVLIPQADFNRRLVYEHERLRRDAQSITEQVKVNDEFLRKVADDPSLAERLAQRQMKIIREGTRVLDLKSGTRDDAEMSPYHLVTVPAPDPLPPFRAKGGALTQACLNPHTRLYLIGGALVLMAAGLVLGYAPKRD